MPLSVIYKWAYKLLPIFLFTLAISMGMTYVYKKGVEAGQAQVQHQLAEMEESYKLQLEANTVAAAEMGILAGSRLAEIQTNSASVSGELKSHFKAQEQKHAQRIEPAAEEPEVEVCVQPPTHTAFLDDRTVSLLNAARENRSPEDGSPSTGADEEVGASSVTVADLALNDLEVVRMYHELATRHDGLVDWVLLQCVDPNQQTGTHESE